MSGLARCFGITRREIIVGAVAGTASLGMSRSLFSASARFEIVGAELRFQDVPVRLVGVAVGDPIYIRKDRPTSDYATLAQDWRVNAVRISLHPGHWRANRERALRRLGAEIQAARSAGLVVILDWHVIGFPDHYEPRPDPSWGLPADAFDPDEALALDFWTEMARSFGRDPGIIFEVWNEPVVNPRLWVSTGEHWPLLKDVWLRLIQAIRRHTDAIVLVSGGRWAHDLKGVAKNLIEDNRVAYAWHCYPPEDRGRPGRWFDSLDGLERVRPIIVTEWGFCSDCDADIRGDAEDFGVPFVHDVLEAFSLHSTAWCWSDGAAPAMLEHDWVTPTRYGRFVRRYLATAMRPGGRAQSRG